MSAINITNQIPNAIVTVEQLFVWAGLMLATMHPRDQTLETDLGAVNKMQSGIFQAADGTTRIFIRGSLELDPTYISDKSSKLWMKVEELGQVTLPAGYTSN